MERYGQTLLEHTRRKSFPIRRKTQLLSNLVKFQPPDTYYVATAKNFKTQKEIYEYFDEKKIEIPPFWFDPKKHQISTFCELNENNPLSEIIVNDPIEIDFNDEKINTQFKILLINQHLRRIFWKKGLRRVRNKNIYFFECFKKDGIYIDRFCHYLRGKKKLVAHPYYEMDKEGNSILNFIFHKAAEIAPIILWGSYYIVVLPRKIYTTDGVTPIEGEKKDAIDRKFRNPTYNRNLSKLLELNFWFDYLFKSPVYETTPESWFKKFRFGELLFFEYELSLIHI